MRGEDENFFSELPLNLQIAYEVAYAPSGWKISQLVREAESQAYEALDFQMQGRHIKFRLAKVTPKKIGQFVTLWKRSKKGTIEPYELSDAMDRVVIGVCGGETRGQFIFSKQVLLERDILSNKGQGGKLAMRVYAPWDQPESRQAKAAQAWQNPYFFEITTQRPLDKNRLAQLFLD